jgi:hypothetical protein
LKINFENEDFISEFCTSFKKIDEFLTLTKDKGWRNLNLFLQAFTK